MSVGDRNRYQIMRISRRHFEQTAEAAGLPKRTLDAVCEELKTEIPRAIEEMAGLADNTVPAALIECIQNGVRERQAALFDGYHNRTGS